MKTKKAKIIVIKEHDIDSSLMKYNIEGELDKDMARFIIESIIKEFDRSPLVKWWQFWK